MKRFGIVVLLVAAMMFGTASRSAMVFAADMPGMSMPATSDHAALAAMYESDAKALQRNAASHQVMVDRYEHDVVLPKGTPFTKDDLVKHCKGLVASYQQAAKDAQAMATMEQQLANAETTKK